jgi:hypothetical protein
MRAVGLSFAVAVVMLSQPVEPAAPIVVPAGGNLQQALNTAQPGDTIVLEAGATYIGNFVLPAKLGGSSAFITIRSSASDDALPGPNSRITPAHAPLLPKIKSPNVMPALATAPRAHHYRLMFLEFQAEGRGEGGIITLGEGGSGQTTLQAVPSDLVMDRVYVHGDPAFGQKFGISVNSASTTVINSHVSDIKRQGQDAQAIVGTNGPGPFTIANNYLEASGENIMFGGADPGIPNLVPSDITITRNHMSKPVAWRSERWTVKNLFELKNARRVAVSDNLLEYNWPGGQSGFAILFTVRNQDGRCPWCQVEQVVFERNVVRHVAAGISILGRDNNYPSQQTRDIVVRHNVFEIDNREWGGNGYFLMMIGEPRDVTVDHNTIIQKQAWGILLVDGPPVLGFVFSNNVARHNEYGIIGGGRSPGMDTIRAFFPASLVANNVIADANPRLYPSGNFYPSSGEFRTQFMSYDNGDYRLAASSAWKGAGSDGLDLGAAVSGVVRRTGEPRAPSSLPRRPER